MKTLGVIPARGGSKGIPLKNIRLLGGKPLLLYTLEAAFASRLDRVIVSTDHPDIAQVAHEAGAEVLIRPAELSDDHSPTLPVLQHALRYAGSDYQAVVTLQPTSPFRTAEHINTALVMFNQHPEADALVSVVALPHQFHPMSVMEMRDGRLFPFMGNETMVLRRQEKSALWARNGAAIYITRSERLGSYVFGGNLLAFEMRKTESMDLDDLEDWALAEALLLWKKENNDG
ncbi:MAG: acylneuraminate cytidylyltransferase family protein [Saprospiraceae bacterium]|nr:acylneuraminate cytidylyltransferase family protein [Saprospiraceae bacterium]